MTARIRKKSETSGQSDSQLVKVFLALKNVIMHVSTFCIFGHGTAYVTFQLNVQTGLTILKQVFEHQGTY